MKLVLISQRWLPIEGRNEVRQGLDARWGKFASALGVLPIPLLSDSNWRELFQLPKISGVILSGGNDLNILRATPENAARDNFEQALVSYSAERGIPALGVCRGCEFLAHLYGAKIQAIKNHNGTRHAVKAATGGDARFSREVNSYHDYAITNLGADLRPLALAPDGTVEAFEHTSAPIAGTMWHPEREENYDRRDIDFICGLFKLSIPSAN